MYCRFVPKGFDRAEAERLTALAWEKYLATVKAARELPWSDYWTAKLEAWREYRQARNVAWGHDLNYVPCSQ